ncbi:MAG: hypothetical protein KDJ73_05985, partial [Notoacmeibacter sp.]|nr:hypothetical protein [Notoacmeibacter sp.]
QPNPQARPHLVPRPSPNRQPVAVPGQLPQPNLQARPYLVPRPIPNRQPVAVPGQVPQPNLQAKPYLVPRPVVHMPVVTGPRNHHLLVTPKPGRQHPHKIPKFVDHELGGSVDCVASGLHRRYQTGPDGTIHIRGVLPDVAVRDPMARDIPARRLVSPECLVKIKRRKQ